LKEIRDGCQSIIRSWVEAKPDLDMEFLPDIIDPLQHGEVGQMAKSEDQGIQCKKAPTERRMIRSALSMNPAVQAMPAASALALA
jgi:hypothetical protein